MLQETKSLLSAGSGLEIYRYIRVELQLPLGVGARLYCADRSALELRLAKWRAKPNTCNSYGSVRLSLVKDGVALFKNSASWQLAPCR